MHIQRNLNWKPCSYGHNFFFFRAFTTFNLPLKGRLRMWVCVSAWSTSSACHPLENKSTQHYKSVQAEFGPVIYGKRGLYGLKRWCQDEQLKKKPWFISQTREKSQRTNKSMAVWMISGLRHWQAPKVFGTNVNVKSAVFFIRSDRDKPTKHTILF